jgi:non-heme chloroperoxidase
LTPGIPNAFYDGTGPTTKDFQNISGPQPSPPDESDLTSFGALQQYYVRVLGFTYPGGELLQEWTSTPDGRIGKQREFPGYVTIMAVYRGMEKYTDIPVPALVIFGIRHGQDKWADSSTDPKVSEAAKAYSEALTLLTESQAKALENGVPTAHVVRIYGAHHYVYLSNEADVLSEMKSFLRILR